MNYYIYISEAKVNMLLPQIPHDMKKKIATEFKLDLKVLSAARKSERESEDNLIVKLEAVVFFIREYCNLGTIEAPDEYIEDTLAMGWGPYGYRFQESSPLVYFGGSTDSTVLGLGGSSNHVIGNLVQSHPYSHSSAPAIVSFLKEHMDSDDSSVGLNESTSMLGFVHFASLRIPWPKQQLRFMAKRLLYGKTTRHDFGPKPDMNVLLATPIYVALDD